LAMGADLVHIARGFMITVGCIQTLKCHSNACPVGVATTDPDLQKALVIDEKKHRTANYLLTLRKGLFRLAAAAGLDSPVHFKREHVMYKDEKGMVTSLEEIYQSMVRENNPDCEYSSHEKIISFLQKIAPSNLGICSVRHKKILVTHFY